MKTFSILITVIAEAAVLLRDIQTEYGVEPVGELPDSIWRRIIAWQESIKSLLEDDNYIKEKEFAYPQIVDYQCVGFSKEPEYFTDKAKEKNIKLKTAKATTPNGEATDWTAMYIRTNQDYYRLFVRG